MGKFKMTDDGELEYILEMKIHLDRPNHQLFVSSKQMVQDILTDFNMAICLPAAGTPMDLNHVAIAASDCPVLNQLQMFMVQNPFLVNLVYSTLPCQLL